MIVAASLYLFCFKILKQNEVCFDEAGQTASDYSIRIENPPTDANSPEEWKTFFSQFGTDDSEDNHEENHVVTCCTVALDNEGAFERISVLVWNGRKLKSFYLSQTHSAGESLGRTKAALGSAGNLTEARGSLQ